MKSNKKKIIISLCLALSLLLIGISYAFFSYVYEGQKSEIITGQIYMNYEETSIISLTGVFPETKEQALAREVENGVFEFTITGRNTSTQPIYYEIDLLDGGVITGKTEASTKILPEHVRIYLEKDGEVLIDGESYNDFNNRRIYTDTIPANQETNIEQKYKLVMWIDENVTISDTDPNADYTTTEWNDAYASLKIRVIGDFQYKEVATDASCFEYRGVAPEGHIISEKPILILDTSEEKVEACKTNLMNNMGMDFSTLQDGYQSFCEGTGTITNPEDSSLIYLDDYVELALAQGITLQEVKYIIPVVSNIEGEYKYYKLNTTEESINSCKEFMLNHFHSDISDAQDEYQSFCEGTGTIDHLTIFRISGNEKIHYLYFEIGSNLIKQNVFIEVENVQALGIEISDYNANCGLDVIVPSIIGGYEVIGIADSFPTYGGFNSFSDKGLTSVKLPNTLQYIGSFAFYNNALTQIVIPDNVTEIRERAFGLDGLGWYADPIEKIVNKSGNAFDWSSILGIPTNFIVQDPGVVPTGTYIYKNDQGVNKTISIVSE